MSNYVNILATNCFFDVSGAPITGTLTITPSSSFSVEGVAQVLGDSIPRKVVNGSIVGSLKLFDPAQTSPQGIGYTFTVNDGRGYILTYANVLISPDVNGNFDLLRLNRGLFETAVPKTVVSINSQTVITGTGTGADNAYSLTSGPSSVSAFTVVAIVGGQGVTASSSNASMAGSIAGLATQSVGASTNFTVQFAGEISYNGWNWIPGKEVFLSPTGVLTQSPPVTGFLQVMGVANTPTSVVLSIQQPILFQ